MNVSIHNNSENDKTKMLNVYSNETVNISVDPL